MLLALASLPTRQPVVFAPAHPTAQAWQGRTAQAMASAPCESCTPPRLLFYLARLDQRQTRHISSTLTPSSSFYVLQTLLPSTTTTTITHHNYNNYHREVVPPARQLLALDQTLPQTVKRQVDSCGSGLLKDRPARRLAATLG